MKNIINCEFVEKICIYDENKELNGYSGNFKYLPKDIKGKILGFSYIKRKKGIYIDSFLGKTFKITEKEFKNKYPNLFIKNDEIWEKSSVLVRFSLGKIETIFFNSYEEAEKYAEEIQNKSGVWVTKEINY